MRNFEAINNHFYIVKAKLPQSFYIDCGENSLLYRYQPTTVKPTTNIGYLDGSSRTMFANSLNLSQFH